MNDTHAKTDIPPVYGESLPLLHRDLCYLDYLRRGESPPEGEPAKGVEEKPPAENPTEPPCYQPCYQPTGDPLPAPITDSLVELADLATDLPDPARPFWWYSSDPVPDLKIVAGRAMLEAAGSRLAPEADWWCHEGDPAWTKVNHEKRPKPALKPKQKKKQKERSGRYEPTTDRFQHPD